METLAGALATALYFAAFMPLLRDMRAGKSWNEQSSAVRALVAAGLLTHAIALYGSVLSASGLSITVSNAASLFLWQCTLLVWLANTRQPLGHLYLTLLPATAIAALLGLLAEAPATEANPVTWTIGLHIALSMLAYGLLTIAAVQGLALAIQDRLLHSHESRRWLRLIPPLQTMEQILFRFMGGGFLLLSLALLSGLIFVEDFFAQHLVHKTTLSIIAWLVFGILLWGRWQFGWRGKTAIRWTLGGYSTLLLAYFGSKWVLEVVLGTGWQ